MKILSYKRNLLLLTTLVSVISLFTEQAQAGVLFWNRRNVVRITQPRLQSQQYKVRRSTAVMRSTSKGLFGSKSYGGVSDTMKLVRANLKYEKALAKWELKKFKEEKAAFKLRQKAKEKEEKQRERASLRNKRFNGNFGKSLLASVTGGSSSSTGQISTKPAARGALTNQTNIAGQQPQKKGFFATLWEALLGRKG